MTRRLVLSYLAVTIFVLAVLEVPLALNYSQHQVDSVTSKVLRDAYSLTGGSAYSLAHLDDVTAKNKLAALAKAKYPTGRVIVTDSAGLSQLDTNPIAGLPESRAFGTRPEVAKALGGEISSGTRDSSTLGGRIVFIAVPVFSNSQVVGVVRVTYPIAYVYARIHRYWILLGALALITLLGVTVIGIFAARWVSRPLKSVQETAEDFGRGELTSRAPTRSGPPEVRSLANSFNRTAERLQELITSQDAFVADASHQLRTPLTALRLRLENLEPDVRLDASDDLEAALGECDRLSRLVDGLLALARAERGTTPELLEPIDIAAALGEREYTWSPFAAEHDVRIVVDAFDGLTAMASPDHLSQVLDNLIANAIDHSPDGGTITLSARPGLRNVTLHVIDQGPGMSAEDRAHAFDRFWRADEARAGLGGSGLGLSIVEKLVRAGGGSVALLDAPGHGLDAAITLPAALPAPVRAPARHSV